MTLFLQFIETEFEGNQAKAAAALGVDRSMVSRICRGERGVSPALAEKIEVLTGGKYPRAPFIWPSDHTAEAASGDDPDAGRIIPIEGA